LWQCVYSQAAEHVPLTPSLAIDLLHEAGLPPGVLNLVHGIAWPWMRCCIIR